MFIISYVLNSDGTIPVNITDGGYFPVKNNNPWPEDLTLCGVATSVEQYHEFTTEQELCDYLTSVCSDWKNPDGTPFDPVYNANWLWSKAN